MKRFISCNSATVFFHVHANYNNRNIAPKLNNNQRVIQFT